MFSRRFSVAPMMDRTDRHCRVLMRLISKRALLYSEMVTSAALTHSPTPERFLVFSPLEHPVALQLGGSNPTELAKAARMAVARGYDEINLNVGCPSDRVTSGRFGACLMAEPQLVAECIAAMRAAVSVPVTVKTRIGIDDLDTPEYLLNFVDIIAATGCETFIIHARKAWLKGLSPKENREIPPLHYERVHALKSHFPQLEFILNGGLKDLQGAFAHLEGHHGKPLDGIMIGRAAYDMPYMLSEVDRLFYGSKEEPPPRADVVASYVDYAARQQQDGVPLRHILRHAVGLFHGRPGARAWRQAIMAVSNGDASLAGLGHMAARLDTMLAEVA